MPEVQTYLFTHKEIVELMIKASGLHEGKWMLQVGFGFTAGNFGQSESEVQPGGIVLINHIGLTKAKEDSPSVLTLDAAKVNPHPST